MDISRRGFLKLLGITGVAIVTKPKLDIPELPKEPPKEFPYTASGSCSFYYGIPEDINHNVYYRNTQYINKDRIRCKCCGKYQVRGKLDCPHCGAEYDEPIGFDWN